MNAVLNQRRFLCSGAWLMPKPTAGLSMENKCLLRSQQQMAHLYHILSPWDPQSICGRQGRKTVRDRGQGGPPWQGHCTHEFTAAGAVCTSLTRGQLCQHCSLERRMGSRAPHPGEGAFDNVWLLGKEETVFFKGMAPGRLTLLWWVVQHQSKNWAWWVIKI